MPNTATVLRWLGGAGIVVAAVLWIVGLRVTDPATRAMLLFLAGVCLNVGVLSFVAWLAVDALAEETGRSLEPLIAEQRRLADAVVRLGGTTVADAIQQDTPGQ
ncbi:MAG TPA: hypothetical protein VGK53_09885 [Propionicimonas sp.]|jgi:hypothetical protein